MTQQVSASRTSPWRRGIESARTVRVELSATAKRHGLTAFFIMQIIAMTFLQKFAMQLHVQLGGFYLSVGSVQLVMPVFYAGLVLLFITAKPKVDLVRLALFTAFVATIIVSLALQTNPYSPSSVMLAVACYLPFILKIDVDATTYRKMLKIFLNFMLFFGVVVLIQQAVQIIWSWRLWPNLDELVSPDFLLPGFNYIQAIKYGSRLMKPNSVFFLEVSTVSQFIALAVIVEVMYFQRLWRLAFYTFVLLATFAGTGPLLILMCAPVVLWKLNLRSILLVLAVFSIGYVAADRIQWYQQVQGRLTEYKSQGSSANKRFIEPLEAMAVTIQKPEYILSGIGPGNTAKNDGTVAWAISKVAVEYGLLCTVAFFGLVGYSLFGGAPSKRLAFALLIFFNFMGGGIIIPVYPMLIFLFGGLFRVKAEKGSSRKGTSHTPPTGLEWLRRSLGLGGKRSKGSRGERTRTRATS